MTDPIREAVAELRAEATKAAELMVSRLMSRVGAEYDEGQTDALTDAADMVEAALSGVTVVPSAEALARAIDPDLFGEDVVLRFTLGTREEQAARTAEERTALIEQCAGVIQRLAASTSSEEPTE